MVLSSGNIIAAKSRREKCLSPNGYKLKGLTYKPKARPYTSKGLTYKCNGSTYKIKARTSKLKGLTYL